MDVTNPVGPASGSLDKIRLLCAFGGLPGPSEDLWGPQKGVFGPLGVLIWPQSGPKCHIIMCYTRWKCFRVIRGLSWQHLVRSSFYPSKRLRGSKITKSVIVKFFWWAEKKINISWSLRVILVRFEQNWRGCFLRKPQFWPKNPKS